MHPGMEVKQKGAQVYASREGDLAERVSGLCIRLSRKGPGRHLVTIYSPYPYFKSLHTREYDLIAEYKGKFSKNSKRV